MCDWLDTICPLQARACVTNVPTLRPLNRLVLSKARSDHEIECVGMIMAFKLSKA